MALETQGLSKRYCFAWALQGCSLRIPQGKVAAIVGPNGSGKSTVLFIRDFVLRNCSDLLTRRIRTGIWTEQLRTLSSCMCL